MNREDFPILKNNIIYLDNGATSLKPSCVINKITDYYTNYSANAHRGDYDLSFKVDYEYEKARDIIKDFINARYREEIIFTSGATDSLNIIATGFFKDLLDENDEILITKSEHASNVMPWYRLAKEIGCKIRYITLDNNYYVTMDNFKKAFNSNTKVVALAEITNVVGDIRPIKEITKIAHENNAFVVVDGAQSVPHIKTNVIDSDIDFLAFSGHKMCGPTGIGILYGKKELLDKVIPINLGGGMNESFDDPDNVYLKQLPQRLEAGTPNIAGAIGLGEAAKYIESIGISNIHKREVELRSYLVDKLLNIPHIDIINTESDSGIVAFNVDGIFSQDVAYYLNKYHICVRAGNHCAKVLKSETHVANTLRVSIYFYNTKEEIDLLVNLLKDKSRILKEML